GFVDAHAHGDPFGDGRVLLAQGITTIVLGQDGKSAERVDVLCDKVDREGTRVNVATLFGHATARVQARLPTDRAPNATELARLSAKVARAMDDGAFGLSTGLEYEPGSLAGPDELAAAATPVGERGGIVMSHLRSEDDDKIMGSLDELFEQCRRGHARAHVSHIKIVLGKGEARARAVLDRLDEARRSGLEVTADLYPYTASYTSTGILFPAWSKPPASFSRAKKERRDELLAALRDKVNQRGGPEKTLFGTGALAGKTLAEVAAQSKEPFEEVLFDQGPGAASAAYFVMDDAVVRTFFDDPHVMIGTDGGGGLHPRNAGTFAKILGGYVRDEKRVPLEEGIRKMAALPLQTLGVTDRGTLVVGAGADVLVFDLAAIHDRATFTAPFAESEGMSVVVVGGLVEWSGGKPTSARGGRALRRGKPSVRTPE
ncbi:MAG TPA: amidohydrolase family protein, partial [Polyangiaceae bacterium]|nr:amidohydrolase family protein [Polyangiaceae bacterium]